MTWKPCPVIPVTAASSIAVAYQQLWNHSSDVTRERMKALLPEVARTDNIPSRKLAYFWADRTVREIAPFVLDTAGLTREAEKLRDLDPVVSHDTAKTATQAAKEVEWAITPPWPVTPESVTATKIVSAVALKASWTASKAAMAHGSKGAQYAREAAEAAVWTVVWAKSEDVNTLFITTIREASHLSPS